MLIFVVECGVSPSLMHKLIHRKVSHDDGHRNKMV